METYASVRLRLSAAIGGFTPVSVAPTTTGGFPANGSWLTTRTK